jgi:hypothetical protein
VALNTGVFWGRRRLTYRPGTAVIEFLPVIPPGLPRADRPSRSLREDDQAAAVGHRGGGLLVHQRQRPGWGRRRLTYRPGTAVIEFLPVIPPGLPRETFLPTLQAPAGRARRGGRTCGRRRTCRPAARRPPVAFPPGRWCSTTSPTSSSAN